MGIFGIPTPIRSDHGAAFTSRELKELCKENNIEQISSPSGDHRGTGQIERLIRQIKERIGSKEIETKGEKTIPSRNSVEKSTVGTKNNSLPRNKKNAI